MEQWPGRELMAALEGRGQQECHILSRAQAHTGGAAVETPRVVLRDPGRSCRSCNVLLA